MALILSPLAIQDIESIGDYIADDNPGRAVSFMKELHLQCQQIGETPTLYRQRPELGETIRCCPYGRYLILFSEQQNNVRIQRVLHSARDVPQLSLD
ncbi:type II toxin-antitoxin system RelE/ParE family toxin [Buttiauxella ferragutiae]|uniref:type II toxin-antitoxin system RelE/ParE family toxin n=1 Tax=Buttiauxella ferragutiae TaxID=82989 RepID=UPI001F5348F7|nr:type II toxin-antitoxin system RelE/ParE family toxin [Buttiauxella ferragutiae]UNK63029.1 type II toxin-antitoxin system RelE/ParE family toxin [Buttiauxella ferragutiae]